jgi:hypothetical protein
MSEKNKWMKNSSIKLISVLSPFKYPRMQLNFECCICFCDINVDEKTILSPCHHEFCRECIMKNCMTCGPKCPLCRSTICSLDPFRTIATDSQTTMNFKFDLGEGFHAGVALCNATHPPGVVVKRLKKKDKFARLIKVGDIICSANGIPLRCHEEAVSIIDAVTQRNGYVILQVHRKSNSFYLNYMHWKDMVLGKKKNANSPPQTPTNAITETSAS